MTRQDIVAILGPVEDTLVTEVIATGATPVELAEAWAWINSDEALMGDGRALPAGRVAALVDLLSADEDEQIE
jgi:hypothetical protein